MRGARGCAGAHARLPGSRLPWGSRATRCAALTLALSLLSVSGLDTGLAQSDPSPARDQLDSSLHPLLARIAPPAWLAERRAILVLRPPALEAGVEAAWALALRGMFIAQARSTTPEFEVSPDGSRDALVARLRAASRDTGVSLTWRRDQQRVILTARYVDARVEPPVEHVSEASAPLDAFLAQVVGGVDAVRASAVRTRTLRFDTAGLLGLGVADLNGDQRDELIVARAPHVSAYALEHEGGARLRLVRLARGRWPAAPPRVPMVRRAEAWFSVQAGRLVVGRSDREGEFALVIAGEELQFQPVASECAGGQLFPDGCARWVPGRDYFDGEILPRGAPDQRADGIDDPDDPDDADDEAPSRAPRFYARAQRGVLQPDGSERTMTVLLTPRGSLLGRVADRQGSAGGQGASLAAADVDADGALDILTSDFIREGQEDRLRWFRLSAEGRLVLLWESPRTPGSVLHSVTGDFLGTGRAVFVAFETRPRGGSRVWVVD